jgi:hypothetical protein
MLHTFLLPDDIIFSVKASGYQLTLHSWLLLWNWKMKYLRTVLRKIF